MRLLRYCEEDKKNPTFRWGRQGWCLWQGKKNSLLVYYWLLGRSWAHLRQLQLHFVDTLRMALIQNLSLLGRQQVVHLVPHPGHFDLACYLLLGHFFCLRSYCRFIKSFCSDQRV
ncbi:hypothetical protein EDC52_10937 [Biostraticola tofi]|uniref:Uncharacterized protein n=1 Tax=Biostraticola tofi TaxID=466109 RepID=A0A4R3YMI0_9GAMM|nr:hypothetical protein EDC52_10937 [Biostraticola tofi]